MGSVFRLEMHAPTSALAEKAADAAFAEVDRLNQIASDYLPGSELSRLNLQPSGIAVPVSAELFELLDRSVACSRATGGAFDITAAYAVQHWRRARRQKQLPTPEQTARAVAMTDWRALKLDPGARTVTKLKEGLILDLGGIGKGYAADRALAVLRRHGISRALVAASGDLAIGEAPPGEPGWPVALRTFERPEEQDALIHLILVNCGCSTSGDLHQFLELGGRRYSHIIDPKTGLGLTTRIACTVISPDATTSDAWATALCVMGADRGLALVKATPSTQARFTFPDAGGKVQVSASAGFAKLVRSP